MMEQITTPENQKQKTLPVTPEFIRAVTVKVYALWLRDLALQQERQGHVGRRNRYE